MKKLLSVLRIIAMLVVNLAIILVAAHLLEFRTLGPRYAFLYLFIAWVMVVIEDFIWDTLRGNR